MKYRNYANSYIIKPYGQPIYCEEATRIELEDDGGGLFVSIKQANGEISLSSDEWPLIKEAVDRLLGTIEIIEIIEPLNTSESEPEKDWDAS